MSVGKQNSALQWNCYFQTWCSSGFNTWTFIFLLYINNLSKIISDKSNHVSFADDTSIIITNSYPLAFINNINEVFREIN